MHGQLFQPGPVRASEDKLVLTVLGKCVAVHVVEEGLWCKEFSALVVLGVAIFVQAALLSSDGVTGGGGEDKWCLPPIGEG